jgi:cytochrome c oxidase subunit IV
MVSALAYLLYAMNAFFHSSGALTTSLALSALVVGAGLLIVAAFWSFARRRALKLVPTVLRARPPAG